MNIMKAKSRRGSFLIEAMIALSVISVGLIAVLGLLSRVTGQNRTISNYSTANFLALEGVEIVKNMIDGNAEAGRAWNDGLSGLLCFETDYLGNQFPIDCPASYTGPNDFKNVGQNLRIDQDGKYNYVSGNTTTFKRVIRVEPISGNEVKVNSVVYWTERGGAEFNIDLERHFYNLEGVGQPFEVPLQ